MNKIFRDGLWMAALITAFCFAGAELRAGQFSAAQAVVSATEIPPSAQILPDQLIANMKKKGAEVPMILAVGSPRMYAQGHIPGAVTAGPGAQAEGQELLKSRVASVAKTKYIVIYCGCCPWTRCPNMGTAYLYLTRMGFKNVKALYLPTNFNQDWVSKGYPVEK